MIYALIPGGLRIPDPNEPPIPDPMPDPIPDPEMPDLDQPEPLPTSANISKD